MDYGIALYIGLGNALEENLQLIEEAYKRGINKVFTSLHIPEVDYSVYKDQISKIFSVCKKNNMDIISDISPETIKMLGSHSLDLSLLKDIGIHTIRIDYGYDEKTIAELTHNNEGIKVQLNASTITEEILSNLEKYGADFSNIDALHNFYPRKGTGISEKVLLSKTKILKDRGIKVYAFICSNNRRRAPFYDGLPTMEFHRGMDVSLAARHLFALGMDGVFIGDSLPSLKELDDLIAANSNVIQIKAKLKSNNSIVIDLLSNIFTSREDEARDAIRAQESRNIISGVLDEENNTYRNYGDITIDNHYYGRYMGELQIIKTPQQADNRVNNVASIIEQEKFLLKYITGGKKFRFVFD